MHTGVKGGGYRTNDCVKKKEQFPNLKNMSGGLNLSRGLNMVGST